MSSKRRKKPAYRPHRVPRQARARTTYDSIVAAAQRLLGKHGYAAVTTNHIADTAGVAIGSVYEYFPDKDSIVAEVARRTVQEILDDIARALFSVPPTDPAAALRAWVHAMFVAVGSRRDLVRVLWREVPFLWDLDEIRELPTRMLALVKSARLPTSAVAHIANLEATTWLLTVMVSQAVITSTVERPLELSEEELEATLFGMLASLLLPHASSA